MNVGMSVHGEKEVLLKIDRAAAALTGANLERMLVAGALLPLNVAKGMAPVKTGNLRRSLHIGGHQSLTGGLRGTTGTAGGTSGTNIGGNSHTKTTATILAGTNVSYAHSLEEGAGPHDIRPVNAKALFWPGAAHPVRVVHHPGNAPHPFLRPAFDEGAPAMARECGVVAMAMVKAAI